MTAEPLFITLADDSWQRHYHAFVLAAGALSLGREVVLFAGGRSVLGLVQDPVELVEAPEEAELDRKGLPGLVELREVCQSLGMRLQACESGLKLAGIDASSLQSGVEVGGVVGFLAEAGNRPVLAL